MARILIVGKQSAENDGLSLVMEFAGHKCASARSLKEAEGLIQKEPHDLVLADSTLGDGAEQIVRNLKAIAPGVAVMVLTDDTDFRFGGDEVITSPYSPVQNLSPKFCAIRRKEAFEILLPEEKSLRALPELPQTAGMLNRLAVLYHSQQKYSAAERLYRRALKASKEASADKPREEAAILNNLARLYHDQDRLTDAEHLYKRSIAIVEKIAGPNDRKAATRLKNLADLYRAEGRHDEAAPLYKRLRAFQ